MIAHKLVYSSIDSFLGSFILAYLAFFFEEVTVYTKKSLALNQSMSVMLPQKFPNLTMNPRSRPRH